MIAEWMTDGAPEIDPHHSDITRFYRYAATSTTSAPGAPSTTTRRTASCTRGAVGVGAQHRLRAVERAQRDARRGVLPGGRLGAPALVREQRRAGRALRHRRCRASEWDSRWWSPIMNAEHLALRERVGMVDLAAFVIFDISGPGALDYLQRLTVATTERAGRPRRLHAVAERRRRLQGRPHDHAPGRRTSSGSSPAALRRMSDKNWFADHLPADGSARSSTRRRRVCTIGVWGPRARDLVGVGHRRRRLERGVPVRHVPADVARHDPRGRLPHLVRRRAGLGAVRAVRAGRAAVGPAVGGRPAVRHGPGRRSACTPRPAGWRRATAAGQRAGARYTWSRPAWRGRRSRTTTSSAGRRT